MLSNGFKQLTGNPNRLSLDKMKLLALSLLRTMMLPKRFMA